MSTIKLIVGLGNPGAKHERDRHNAGFWFVEQLAAASGASFSHEAKFHGELCQASIASRGVRLLKPLTYMNRSGQSVRAVMDYFRIAPGEVLVVHDELDLPPGTARLKRGGGHGGHNGLRDLVSHIGRDFLRLRIGIGHPGDRNRVVGYVLQAPGRQEATLIDEAIREGLSAVKVFLSDGEQKAMNQLHTRANAPRPAKAEGPGTGSGGAGSDGGGRGADADGGSGAGGPGAGAGGGRKETSGDTAAKRKASSAQEQQ